VTQHHRKGDDKISSAFDKEEKEEKKSEEVDKLILNFISNKIMDEMMDLGNTYPLDWNVTPRHKPSSSQKISKKWRSKSNNKCSKWEEFFWNSNGWKDPKKHKFISDLTKKNKLNFIAVSETRRSDFTPRLLKNLCAIS
jgi:hypothetical protein